MHQNVKYELQELERLIAFGEQKSFSDEKKITTIKKDVKKEIDRIKQTFVHEVFTFEDERHLERYIQYHQQALIHLIDKAALFMSDDHSHDVRKKNLYQVFYNAFEQLLLFIEKHFTKYFDQDAKAPEGYITIARKDAATNIRKLKKVLDTKNADPRITDLVLQVLKKIKSDRAEQRITYRKVMYAKEVAKELYRFLEREDEIQDVNEELRQIMYYLNYNSVKVLTYHAHYITALLEESETRAEKIEKLSYTLKKINQAQVKPGIGYNQNGPSLKDQLNIYLSEEIEYQERLQHLTGNSSNRPSDNFLSGFKLKFEASVSQLAYLLRIFLETKIIMNNNLSQVLHFLVKFVVTKRSEAISYNSLRSKFYSVESGTRDSVRNMLVTMIQYIDKN